MSDAIPWWFLILEGQVQGAGVHCTISKSAAQAILVMAREHHDLKAKLAEAEAKLARFWDERLQELAAVHDLYAAEIKRWREAAPVCDEIRREGENIRAILKRHTLTATPGECIESKLERALVTYERLEATHRTLTEIANRMRAVLSQMHPTAVHRRRWRRAHE